MTAHAKYAEGGASLSRLSVHKGQWFSARCRRAVPSGSAPDLPVGGLLAALQTSAQAAASADRSTNARDTAGASNAQDIASRAIQALMRVARKRFMTGRALGLGVQSGSVLHSPMSTSSHRRHGIDRHLDLLLALHALSVFES